MGSNSSKDHGFQPSSSNGYGTTTSASTSRYSHYAGHSVQHGDKNIRQKRYARIDDDYTSLEQVTDALAQAGLESSNLIVGVDFTKSNEWTGRVSFNRRSLHDIGQTPNPYEQAISIIGRSLSAFDEDNLIPCFGFGDASTHDRDVFSFYEDNRPCNGFEEALERYRELVPKLRLSGPTSFAPMIETAISIVDNSGGQYHVLLIIADGQVTRNVDITSRSLSSQEKDTINAIVKASAYPLSIVLVGVGDGPWDMMRQFDDNIPFRAFDNFQFVNFTEIMCKNIPTSKKETEFALAALMEIPSQYKATLDLQLLGQRKGIPVRRCLSPPIRGFEASSSTSNYARFGGQKDPSSPERFHQESKMCPMCSTKRKDLAFGCGHQVAKSANLSVCVLHSDRFLGNDSVHLSLYRHATTVEKIYNIAPSVRATSLPGYPSSDIGLCWYMFPSLLKGGE